jgi:hypothetical protein
MSHRFLALFVIAALAGFPSAAAQAQPLDAFANFDWFRDVVGSCWEGSLPDGRTKDRQCYQARFNHFIFGSIHIGLADQAASGRAGGHDAGFRGESLFFWDSKLSRITFWFWATDGSSGTGYGYLEGELIRFPQFSKSDPNAAPRVRSSWRRLDRDSFRVAREELEGDRWTEKWGVTYRRVDPGEPAARAVLDRWVEMWNRYDLDQVDSLFADEDAVSYFSSEYPGAIRGRAALRDHHRRFGFVASGKPTGSRLWLENLTIDPMGPGAALATATWKFQRANSEQIQSGPVSFAMVDRGGRYRILHAHFANHPTQQRP